MENSRNYILQSLSAFFSLRFPPRSGASTVKTIRRFARLRCHETEKLYREQCRQIRHLSAHAHLVELSASTRSYSNDVGVPKFRPILVFFGTPKDSGVTNALNTLLPLGFTRTREEESGLVTLSVKALAMIDRQKYSNLRFAFKWILLNSTAVEKPLAR